MHLPTILALLPALAFAAPPTQKRDERADLAAVRDQISNGCNSASGTIASLADSFPSSSQQVLAAAKQGLDADCTGVLDTLDTVIEALDSSGETFQEEEQANKDRWG